MRRILFVDDEQKILDGIRRSLRKQRKVWEMEFVLGGAEALERMQEQSFDVLVTDMRMPGIDGAELLTRVQDQYPNVVRLVLSGHAELEGLMRAVPVAHQFLSKPCEPDVLQSVVERACQLHGLLADERLRELVNGMQSLPARPTTYARLTSVLARPDAAFEEVAAVIAEDTGMSVKVLQLVNSSFFGLSQRVNEVSKAISLLGTEMVKNLAMSAEVFRPFAGGDQIPDFHIEELQHRGLLVAELAREILDGRFDRTTTEDAFLAGALFNVGELVLASQMTEKFAELLRRSQCEARPLWRIEEGELGVTSADVGAYLLGVWGLPYSIVEAVAYQHNPKRLESAELGITSAVHVGKGLIAERLNADFYVGDEVSEIDPEYLGKVGMAGELERWRRRAEDLVAERTPEEEEDDGCIG
ncbi:MAG: response regulator [Proteobacteria bacterium]|nr:response regulator [Pseudomonadota bacterium]